MIVTRSRFIAWSPGLTAGCHPLNDIVIFDGMCSLCARSEFETGHTTSLPETDIAVRPTRIVHGANRELRSRLVQEWPDAT
jgi:hypothetical protein